MPCLLTNFGSQESVSLRLHPVSTMGCSITAGIRRGSLALPLFFFMFYNTTSEVFNLKAKEEPQQPGLISYFYVTRLT